MATRVDTRAMTAAQLRAAGWSALVRELGTAGALRYMMDTERGAGDYTAERHARLPDLDVEAIVRESGSTRPTPNGGSARTGRTKRAH